MTRHLFLPDDRSLSDLHVFLGRAAQLGDGSARLSADGSVLAVYVGVLYPAGLLDQSSTVLGLRTFALADAASLNAVVTVRSLIEHLARLREDSADDATPVDVTIPVEAPAVPWAAISPPRGGWTRLDSTSAAVLRAAAKSGIDEIAGAVPAGTGEQIVQRIRAGVWNRPIEGLEHVPAGAAFAALSLGFLAADDEVQVYEAGLWARLSTGRGHVLVKSRVL